jgi:hypothetical protein
MTDNEKGVSVTWKYTSIAAIAFCGAILQLFANFVINDRNVQIRRIDQIEKTASSLETRVDYLATKSDIEALKAEIVAMRRGELK